MKTIRDSTGQGGRCAVETVDEPEAVSDTLQPNLESVCWADSGSRIVQSTCGEERRVKKCLDMG